MKSAERQADLEQILAPVRSEIEEASTLLTTELQGKGASARMQELVAHVSRYRGKRLRSAQVLLVGKGFGNLTPAHLRVAAIIEMIHTATLVHDDILDEATVRRRLPSVNTRWDTNTAVLLGDYIYAKAFSLSTRLDNQLASRVLSEVTKVVCQGEIEQIAHRYDFALSQERYLEMIGAKTAALYASACELGAAYAGAPEPAVAAMHRFGWKLGLAFQIVDDCLDLEGSEEIVGKSLGTDVNEGKLTLPVLVTLEAADAAGRRRIEEIYRSPSVSDRVGTLLREFPIHAGIEASLRRADAFIREALADLEKMPAGPARNSLETMAEYVLARKW